MISVWWKRVVFLNKTQKSLTMKEEIKTSYYTKTEEFLYIFLKRHHEKEWNTGHREVKGICNKHYWQIQYLEYIKILWFLKSIKINTNKIYLNFLHGNRKMMENLTERNKDLNMSLIKDKDWMSCIWKSPHPFTAQINAI